MPAAVESLRTRVADAVLHLGLARTSELLGLGQEAVLRIAAGADVRPTSVRLAQANLPLLDRAERHAG